MQTFLPYADFRKSAECLDDRRFNNQINEALIILRTLTGWYTKHGKNGWPNHPATKMWRGHEVALARYAIACLIEHCHRKQEKINYQRHQNIINALESLATWKWSEENQRYELSVMTAELTLKGVLLEPQGDLLQGSD